MASDNQDGEVTRIIEALAKDSVLRAAVIRTLARDFPKDFLSPVKIQGDMRGSTFVGHPVSCKEWQE